MITITDKTNCCGCQACANICPKGCIVMKADEEGFLYPHVDKTKCVNCGLCEKVCPILHKPQTYPVLDTYAAKHIRNEVKLKSSSGGIFSALAEVILKDGGVVFGAGFDKDWNVVHSFVETQEDLDKLRRSKYVQSDIGKTYQQAKLFLDKGRPVLFTGTPCQIAGLRNYLGKEYTNLLTAELFCHGVPSPGVWAKFLDENFNLSDIKAINFRDKHISWNSFYLSFILSDGSRHAHNQKKSVIEKIFEKLNTSIGLSSIFYNCFFRAFLYELIARQACYACHFRGDRLADFSIGDLWGKWPEIISPIDQKMGISALTVNTDKGKKKLEKLPVTVSKIDFNKVARVNFPLLFSPKPHPKRAEFFARYQTENFNKLVRELLDIKPFWLQIPRGLYRKMIRKMKHK